MAPTMMWPCASSRTRRPLRSTSSSWWAACKLNQWSSAPRSKSSTRCFLSVSSPPALLAPRPQFAECFLRCRSTDLCGQFEFVFLSPCHCTATAFPRPGLVGNALGVPTAQYSSAVI